MGSLWTETRSWKALRAPAQTLPHISIKLYHHHREAGNKPGNSPGPDRDTGLTVTPSWRWTQDRGGQTEGGAHQWTLTQEAWHGSDSFTLRSGQAQREWLSSHELGPAYPCLLLPEAW